MSQKLKRIVMLGVSLSHDTGAALLVDGEVVAAVNEERYNRRKAYFGTPVHSLGEVFRIAGVSPRDVTQVHLANIIHLPQPIDGDDPLELGKPLPIMLAEIADRVGLSRILLGSSFGITTYRTILRRMTRVYPQQLRKLLLEFGVTAPMEYCDHHMAHLASAYFTSGWDECLVISNDAFGDGYCARVCIGSEGTLHDVLAIPLYHSLGNYYLYVTRLCGFKKSYHAGKVTGLAAYGNPERTIRFFESQIAYDPNKHIYVNRGRLFNNEMAYMSRHLHGVSIEDIAAGMQRHLENVLCRFVGDMMQRTGLKKLALAGGIHANVKANQLLLELAGVEGLYVHPNMGDGGLPVGAAYLGLAKFMRTNGKRLIARRLDHVYLGRSYQESELKTALEHHGLTWMRPPDLEMSVAGKLAKGLVVARFDGRMEYGPRALGNRSILFSATDASVNTWLNQRLRRTEFMPFAPVVRDKDAALYFHNYDERSSYAAEFMTITYDVTERCRKEAPAVVHVDGTARPQVIRRSINPSYYRILDCYEHLIGYRVLVNTSFNMHEEPIVCTPDEAIRSFLQSGLDVLILGPFMVERPPG